MPIATKTIAPVTMRFADDGSIPNNALPLVLYRGAAIVGRHNAFCSRGGTGCDD